MHEWECVNTWTWNSLKLKIESIISQVYRCSPSNIRCYLSSWNDLAKQIDWLVVSIYFAVYRSTNMYPFLFIWFSLLLPSPLHVNVCVCMCPSLISPSYFFSHSIPFPFSIRFGRFCLFYLSRHIPTIDSLDTWSEFMALCEIFERLPQITMKMEQQQTALTNCMFIYESNKLLKWTGFCRHANQLFHSQINQSVEDSVDFIVIFVFLFFYGNWVQIVYYNAVLNYWLRSIFMLNRKRGLFCEQRTKKKTSEH